MAVKLSEALRHVGDDVCALCPPSARVCVCVCVCVRELEPAQRQMPVCCDHCFCGGEGV